MIRVISCGKWNQRYVDENMSSVSSQGVSYHHTVKIDGFPHTGFVNGENSIMNMSDSYRGMARNIVETLNESKFDPMDIICLVDLDDKLLPGALKTVEAVYNTVEPLVTYGSYVNSSGYRGRFAKPLSDSPIRSQSWRTSHLKTFRYALWQAVDQDEFKNEDGSYIDTCSDLALMFQLVEIAGIKNVRYISNLLYWYRDHDDNDHLTKGPEQKAQERKLRARGNR